MASSVFSLPTSDMRHSAKQTKRDIDSKTKWAHGSRPGRGQSWDAPTSIRPVMPLAKAKRERRDHDHAIKRMALPSKNSRSQLRSVYTEGIKDASDFASDYSDSLSDDIQVPSATAPSENPAIFYSFDSRSGPQAGEHLLSAALSKAVERFETRETEKLAREYEFVDQRESIDVGYAADDDDFELVEYVTV